jgi:alpha-methylacyl-CoA racemase
VTGPLYGLRVVELVGQGPGPFGAMLLADLGAEVVAVVRPSQVVADDRPATNPLMRGKRSVAIDLKTTEGVEAMGALLAAADVFVDPFRPGVCERLGIGPDEMLAANGRLIYARMTGFGQTGPWARAAGHDINYIAMSGALHAIGYEGQPPTMPINLLGDFAGGGLLMVMGIAAAAYERERSGRGQVIDVAMVDGAAALLGPFFTAIGRGAWGPRGTNTLDGGAPFYQVYETADGEWMAAGAIEPQFYAALLDGLGLDRGRYPQWDRAQWAKQRDEFGALFRTRTRDEWCTVFEGADACVSPVLAATEVADHPHMGERETVMTIDGVLQAAPAPRYSRTPAEAGAPVHPGADELESVLASWA